MAANTIRTNFLRPARASFYPDLWSATWNALQGQERLVRGENRIIIFSAVKEDREPRPELISSILTSSTLVQAISIEDNPNLDEFCLKTRAISQRVAEEEEVSLAIERAYLQLLARCEISYEPASPEARNLKIRAHAPAGWAEMNLPVPAEPSG